MSKVQEVSRASFLQSAVGLRSAVKHRVLVIEDELDIAKLVQLHLQDLPCEVNLAFDGIVGLTEAEAKPYDLIILDLKLPGIDGLEVCRRLRARGRYTPILMLTSKSSELDRVLGLRDGRRRLPDQAVQRHGVDRPGEGAVPPRRNAGQERRAGGVEGDPAARSHHRHRAPHRCGARQQRRADCREFDLLVHFARHPGRVYSRDQLLDQVWGYQHSGYDHTVNSHINRLRAKIERDPQNPEYIHTVWGVGYKFAEGRMRDS